MKKVEIRRIGLGSVFRLFLVMGLVIGLIANVVLLLAGYALLDIARDLGTMDEVVSLGGGAVGCIILSIIYGLLFGVGGVIVAGLYDLFALAVGGIKISLVDRE